VPAILRDVADSIAVDVAADIATAFPPKPG
jgi:hypothetical protein